MKAAVYTSYGPPDVVQIQDVEKPEPSDNEVLIHVRAAAVNPLDMVIKGRPYLARLMTGLRTPRVTRVGVDVAGQVEAVGRHVTQFTPGDEVFGACLRDPHASGVNVWVCQGAFAEYACVPESTLVMKPDTISFEQAAAVPVAAHTALQGLRDKGQLQPGQTVLINGASGGVGTFAVQIAKAFGAAVTGVCSTSHVELVRSIGADQVIDYTPEDFTTRGQRYALDRLDASAGQLVKTLVTGAAGFIGSHLVEALLERGDEVRALVRPDEDSWRLQPFSRLEIFRGDLPDTAALKDAVRGVERVYQLAAKTGPWGMEQTYRAINVQGVSDLVYAAMEAGVRRIVHTSSITVYGHRLRGVVAEDHPYHAENNPYSRSKIAGEKLLFTLVKQEGAPIVIVRPAWVYGPRDSASFSRFVSLVESGKGFIIGTGSNVVPIVYVRDVVQGLIKAGNAGEQVVGRAYTLADDRRVTQLEYLSTIADTLQVPHVSRKLPFFATYMAGRTAEIVWQAVDRRKVTPPPLSTYGITLLGGNQQFSIERARRELGYVPEFDVKCGVAEGVRWYLSAKQRG